MKHKIWSGLVQYQVSTWDIQMKKIFSACTIAAAFVAAPAFAQGYIGLGFGSSSTNGINAGGVNGGNTNKGMVKVYGGFQFTPNWGLEAQYSDLGNRDLTNAANVRIGDYKASQLSIAATGTLPLTSAFSLMGKLGISGNSIRGSAGLGTSNATSALIGVGVSYSFTPALSARLEYEDFGKLGNYNNVAGTGSVKGNAYSISLKYAF